MKKLTNKFLLVSFAILIGCVTAVSAQEYEKGDNLLNVGIGLGGGFGTPIGISFEHGFTDKISAGAMVTYSSTSTATFGGDLKYTYIIAGARGSYHFDFGVEGLDPYLGAMLGYNVATISTPSGYAGPALTAGGFAWGGHAGARYFFSPKFGAFAEVGYGVANLTAGLALKF